MASQPSTQTNSISNPRVLSLQKHDKHKNEQSIRFVKAGETTVSKQYTQEVKKLIDQSGDWTLQSDLDHRLVFPQEIAATNLRPDIILSSQLRKRIILIELTVPWEERIQESHELKYAKYDPIILEAKRKGWDAHCFPIEVGCRGFAGRSLSGLLRALGFTASMRKATISKCTKEAEQSSRWLWIKRDQKWISKPAQQQL